MSTSTQIAEILLDAKAVVLRPQDPFIWASGWRSPIYCDNRVLLSFPEHRKAIKKALVQSITTNYPTANCVAGVATAGIAWASLVAEEINLPMVYVRPTPKVHGMGNQIEGRLQNGQKIVVIEDLVSTGKSSLQVVEVLKKEGAEVMGMVSLFQYGFEHATAAFENAGISLHSLTYYTELIAVAQQQNLVDGEALKSLQNWRESPADWSR